MKSPALLLVFDAGLLALAALLVEQGRMIPAWSIMGALAILGAWQLILFSVTRRPSEVFRIEIFTRSTHYVQGVLQGAIYVYIALYWGDISHYAPLLAAQALVGYLCDTLISWSRGRPVRLGFGIVPVILSTNLFLWFQEDYFYFQLLMVTLAFFSKDFLTWNYRGRRRHIFNPSAFPLSVVSVILLVSGTVDVSRGVDLVQAFELSPNFCEVIFLLGLVTQGLFLTTPVSLGASLSLYALHLGATFVCGEQISPVAIQNQVFLGLTFLVTDPATSPRSSLGKLLFGITYGTGVFVTFVALRLASQPSYFDKLLIVPVVNLLVPIFDRISDWLERGFADQLARSPDWLNRFGWLVAYTGLFIVMIPSFKVDKNKLFTILPPPVSNSSESIARLIVNHIYCRQKFPDAYKPFGLWNEFANLSAIRRIYYEGPPDDASKRERPPGQ